MERALGSQAKETGDEAESMITQNDMAREDSVAEAQHMLPARSVFQPFVWVLAHKAICVLVVVVTLYVWPPDEKTIEKEFHWPRNGPVTLATWLSSWDAAHYLYLSEEGYTKGSPSCAFYPLFPMLIRGVSHWTQNSFLSGILIANIFSITGLLLFHWMVASRYGRRTADRALLILLTFPGALFFHFAYTEPLFFFLVVAFFSCFYREKYVGAAVLGFFLPLTRAIGVFAACPLAHHLLERRKHWRTFLVCLGPAFGILCYFSLMNYWTGSPFEGMKVQDFFPTRPSLEKIFDIPGLWGAFTRPLSFHGMVDSGLDRAFFVGMLLGSYWVYRLDRTYFVYMMTAGVIPALTSYFMSYTRYVMMCFPLFIVLGQGSLALSTLTGGRRLYRYLFWAFLGGMALLQIWLLTRYVQFKWAG